MEEYKRTYEVEYMDTSLEDGFSDVTIELSEDTEAILFNRLRRKITEDAVDGIMPDQMVHLYRRLLDQKGSHPPWFEVESDERVYDLEMTKSDYRVLSSVIGSALSNVLSPEKSDSYFELVDVLEDVSYQMVDESGESDEPSCARFSDDDFVCYIRSGNLKLYDPEEISGLVYICSMCDAELEYLEIQDHDCGDDE